MCSTATGQQPTDPTDGYEEGIRARQGYLDRISALRQEIERRPQTRDYARPRTGEAESDHIGQVVRLSRMLVATGQYDEAVARLIGVLDRDRSASGIGEARKVLGRLYLILGRHRDVETLLDTSHPPGNLSLLASISLAQVFFEFG